MSTGSNILERVASVNQFIGNYKRGTTFEAAPAHEAHAATDESNARAACWDWFEEWQPWDDYANVAGDLSELYLDEGDDTAALARDINACQMCGAIGKHRTAECDQTACNMKNCLRPAGAGHTEDCVRYGPWLRAKMAKNPTRGMQLRRLQTMAKGRGRGKPFSKGKGKGRGFGKRTGPVPDYTRQHMFTAIDAPSQPYNDSKVTWADQQLSSAHDRVGEINAEIGALVLEKGKADVSDTSRIAHIDEQIEVLHGLIDNKIGMTAIADGVISPPTDASSPPLMVRPTNGLPREGKVGPLLSAGSDWDLLSHPPSPLPISVDKTAANSHTSFDPMIHAAPLLFDDSSLATTLLPNGYTLSSHNVANVYHSAEPSFENGWAGLLDLETSATPANPT